MSQHKNMNYGYWAKTGFLLGIGLIVFGVGGELIGHAFFEPMPAWENMLFTYAEGTGLVIGFFSPWIFGVALPLLK
jgi:hypothetical protein